MRQASRPTLATATIAVAAIDLASKQWAQSVDEPPFWVKPVRNDELALGVTSPTLTTVLILSSFAVAILLHSAVLWRRGLLATVWVALLLGGVIANVHEILLS